MTVSMQQEQCDWVMQKSSKCQLVDANSIEQLRILLIMISDEIIKYLDDWALMPRLPAPLPNLLTP